MVCTSYNFTYVLEGTRCLVDNCLSSQPFLASTVSAPCQGVWKVERPLKYGFSQPGTNGETRQSRNNSSHCSFGIVKIHRDCIHFFFFLSILLNDFVMWEITVTIFHVRELRLAEWSAGSQSQGWGHGAFQNLCLWFFSALQQGFHQGDPGEIWMGSPVLRFILKILFFVHYSLVLGKPR